MKLKIMTYNIAGGRSFVNGKEKPIIHDPDATAAVIRAEAPDVCGLNEVDYNLPRSGRIKLARYIGEALGYESAFAPAITWAPGTYGNGFVSAHPIREVEIFPIPDPIDRSEDTYYETRVILHTIVDFDGHPADIYVTHFGLARAEAANAVKTLVGLIKDAKHPVILMGDFNLRPNDSLLDPIRALLDDTFAVYPDQDAITFPSHPSISDVHCKIDYIFVSRDIKTESVKIVESRVSDHKGYVATIELP